MKRVLIVGAESTGKTTLAMALAEHYQTTLEGLRPVILGQSGSNPAPVRAGGDSLG